MKSLSRYILGAACFGLLTLSFNCDLFTGPHNGGGADTTSHAFTWQTFMLGDGNASTVNGVTILNDSLVYVAGDIEKLDSNGQFQSLPYNLARWNGQAWQLITLKYNCRLYYPNCGPDPNLYSQATAVYAFGPNDVWIAAGSVHHLQDTTWTEEAGIEGAGSANKIWGNSPTDLWFVGNVGFVAHRNTNGVWQNLNSGTATNINDVWGIGNSTVYCAVSNDFDPNAERRILRITNGNKVDTVSWIGRTVGSVWTPDGTHLYACGDGVFENDGSGWKEMLTGASVVTSSIRGNATNDFVVVGGNGIIAHWNGNSFKIYPSTMNVIYKSVAMRGNLVVAVGTTGVRAVVRIGRRL